MSDQKLSRRDFIKGAAVGAVTVAGAGVLASTAEAQTQCPSTIPAKWDKEADVVVAGAGATGLPAAVEAADRGASVILIDKNFDVGGGGLICGGIVGLGGGTALQTKLGVKDSADIIYKELTTGQLNKFNDPAMMRAYADLSAESIKFLEDNGVKFVDLWGLPPPIPGVSTTGMSRYHLAGWKEQGSKRSPGHLFLFNPDKPENTSCGAGIFRPLEDAARKKGIQIIVNCKLTKVIREKPLEGRVLGIEAEFDGKKMYIRAKRGVIIATGGVKGNVQLRKVFDPRLGEEYQADGEPWCFDTGDGIIAAQEVGGQIASDYGQEGHYVMPRVPTSTVSAMGNYGGPIGCKYAAIHYWGAPPGSPVYDLQKAEGLEVKDPQDLIHVKKSGKRFFNESSTDELAYCDAAMADGGGPVWAIFDADAAKREKWVLRPPIIDPEYFFSGDTIEQLASKITWKGIGVPAAALAETVRKYNSYVDSGTDPDFKRPKPKYKVQTPPFYAAWATPVCHNPLSGLRINEKSQVIDIYGKPIPGLYAGGEAAGGTNLAGVSEAIVQGRIAAKLAAADKSGV